MTEIRLQEIDEMIEDEIDTLMSTSSLSSPNKLESIESVPEEEEETPNINERGTVKRDHKNRSSQHRQESSLRQ